METYPEYLLRVANDFEDSGNEATAEDYREMASRIEKVNKMLDRWDSRIPEADRPVGIRRTREILNER